MRIGLAKTSLMALALWAVPATSLACTVCYGDPNSPMVKAMGQGILFLLGCIGFVLAAFACMFTYWIFRVRRGRMLADGVND